MLAALKDRLTTLNILRLIVGVSFVGEGIHSKSVVFGIIGLVFLLQILLNKKCSTGCPVDE